MKFDVVRGRKAIIVPVSTNDEGFILVASSQSKYMNVEELGFARVRIEKAKYSALAARYSIFRENSLLT